MSDGIKRIVDKYQGIKFCDLPAEHQEEYLGAIAERGASEILKKLGLDDDLAASDLRDVRDLLKGFRVLRKTMFTTLFMNVGRIIGWAVLLALGALFMHNSSTMQKIIQRSIEP